MVKQTIVSGMAALALAWGLQALPPTTQEETDEWIKTLSVEVNDERMVAEVNDELYTPQLAEVNDELSAPRIAEVNDEKGLPSFAEVNDEPRFAEVNDEVGRA